MRASTFLLAISLLLMGSTGVLQAQQEVTLLPIKDNTLFENDAGTLSSGVGTSLYVGRTNRAGVRRALIAFDVAADIPAGATIESAALTLQLAQTNTGTQTVNVHRVLADWGEGTSSSSGGRGANATAGDATWLHTFFDTDRWGTAGGDFDNASSATLGVGGLGTYTWESTPELVADVQAWLDDPENNNFGWILIGNETTGQTAQRYESREGNNAPMLAVTFSVTTALEDVPGPEVFALESYPNPFAGQTTLAYTLPTPQDVRVEVFSLLGQRVRTLVHARQAAGRHSVLFDAVDLPGGMYLYRVTTANTSAVRRLVVLD